MSSSTTHDRRGLALADVLEAGQEKVIRVTPLHKYYFPTHVDYVRGLMLSLGPPMLRGFFDDVSGAWMLCEGTHRIRAAHELGLMPVLVAIPWWRSKRSLVTARFAAAEYGLAFGTKI